jgi:hypothetical protein
MLRCAVLNVSVGTALRIFRNPSLRFPLGSGAGPILIAGCAGKCSATFLKKRLPVRVCYLTNRCVHFSSRLVEMHSSFVLGGEL